MSIITPVLLRDTFNLIQLARETAQVQGQQDQAQRLTPVIDGLRDLVSDVSEAKPLEAATGFMAQDDFQTLLAAVQSRPEIGGGSLQNPMASSPAERNQVVTAMSAGGMPDVDIARQMGMTRDEVQFIVSISRSEHGSTEVWQ